MKARNCSIHLWSQWLPPRANLYPKELQAGFPETLSDAIPFSCSKLSKACLPAQSEAQGLTGALEALSDLPSYFPGLSPCHCPLSGDALRTQTSLGSSNPASSLPLSPSPGMLLSQHMLTLKVFLLLIFSLQPESQKQQKDGQS